MKPKKLKSTRWRKRLRKQPMALRHEALREVLCRLVLLGLTAEQIARKLHRTSRAIRYAISTPEFADRFEAYRREQFGLLDHKIASLLPVAVDQMAKLLRHPNWKARNAAISRILDTNAPVLQRMVIRRLEAQRPLDPVGTVQILPPMVDLTDEQRAAARDLLKVFRGTQPRPSLPERIQEERPDQDRDRGSRNS